MTYLDHLQQVATALELGHDLPMVKHPPFHMMWVGKVVAKERPKFKGHAYTPKATREFEASVKRQAEEVMHQFNLSMTWRPIVVQLNFYDIPPQNLPNWHQRLIEEGAVFPTNGGDLDNKEKSVLDALNKVFYHDDSQIVSATKQRVWRYVNGFDITLTPIGYTPNDLVSISRLMGNGKQDH